MRSILVSFVFFHCFVGCAPIPHVYRTFPEVFGTVTLDRANAAKIKVYVEKWSFTPEQERNPCVFATHVATTDDGGNFHIEEGERFFSWFTAFGDGGTSGRICFEVKEKKFIYYQYFFMGSVPKRIKLVCNLPMLFDPFYDSIASCNYNVI